MANSKPAIRCDRCAASHKRCDHLAGKRILIIPDTQVKPGVPLDHLTWAGKYIAHKRPDIVVQIGDFADMPSLSSYDKGKKCFEGRRYRNDIDAARAGMELLMAPLTDAAADDYHPRLILTLGNHEERINRAIEDDPKLDGTIGVKDLGYEEMGWEVHDFLDVVPIEGIEFSHYFVSGMLGRPVSSAAVMLRERMGSAVQGHNQKFDLAVHPRTGHIAMMCGAFYQHDEEYLGSQGQAVRLQLVVLNEVRNGRFDPMLVSMDFLRRRYS